MIRSATAQDFPAMAQVSAEAMPHNPLTETSLTSQKDSVADGGLYGYWVYESDGKIVGLAYYMQWADMYDPLGFHISVQVHPDHQQKGIGTELYATLADKLLAHNPLVFKSSIFDGDVGAKEFSAKYGFLEYSRRTQSSCDLTNFNPDDHNAMLAKLAEAGYEFSVLADITDEETLREIYDLQWTLELDVPIDETLIKRSYKQWHKDTFDSPSSLSQASLVAKKDGKYAGLTITNKLSDTHAYCEFTGTRSKFRREGIATALKICAMHESKKLGYTIISTTNDDNNAPMLALNVKLGFVPKPARIQIQKTFTEN